MEVLNLKNRLLERVSNYRAKAQEVVSDVLLLDFGVVNAFLIGDPLTDRKDFVLVDTGIENSYDFIIETAEKRFGKGTKPDAIILTHGHFDHIGSAKKLAEEWDVPIYVHPLELPYFTGERDYPSYNSEADGQRADLGEKVYVLPEDGKVPGLPGWKWIHTPGHTKGHISLFREKDRFLIAGDAFVTVKQEYLYKVFTQEQEISGPPRYLTTDWDLAWASVKKLEALKPSVAVTGHGLPMSGERLAASLKKLVQEFDRIAIPERGKYVKH